MDEAGLRTLRVLLERHRDEIVERGTDWVTELSHDLSGEQGRQETRELIERVVSSQAAVLLAGDEQPLEECIEFVTTVRAAEEFRASTVLRSLLSFRRGLEEAIRREDADWQVSLDVLAAVDRVAHAAVFQASDLYTQKLHRTILERRAQLEEELAEVTEAKERELNEKLRTIDEQREALNALSSPVIQVWEGILVVPLIGEISGDRASAVEERVLTTVVATKSLSVLVDITGLTVTDEQLASEVLRLVRSVRLLGADAMLCGVTPGAALALSNLDVSLEEIRSFATLHDGLRAALRRAGYRMGRG